MVSVLHVAPAGLVGETEWEAEHVVTGLSTEGAVPVGGIIMWSGTIATIPTPEWGLCDGTANAPGPDLRDKFIVGASEDASPDSAYADAIVADAPNVYYRLGEASGDVIDTMGGLSGTVNGTATRDVAGALVSGDDGAIALAGTGWITVPDQTPLDTSDVFTFECWVKIAGSTGTYRTFAEKVGAYAVEIWADDKLQFIDQGNVILASSSTTITDTTTWHHIACTKNGATSKIYIDGADVTTVGTNGTVSDTANDLGIGATAAGGGIFNGSMDEVAIYPTALSAAQVLAHYTLGTTPGVEVAQTTIQGAPQVSQTATGATVANHAALTHANGAVAAHTGLSHDGSVASHPDLTHAALSHAAVTVVHADHSLASASHSHASGADVSVASQAIASALASRPSGSIASHAAVSVPTASWAAGAGISVPSGSIASGTHSHAATTVSGSMVSLNTGVLTTPTAATRGLLSATNPGVAIPSMTASHASATFASLANASYPSGNVAAVTGSNPSASFASGVDVSVPAGAVAATTASRPTLSGSAAAVTATHADHSLASASHQAIGTHAALTHGFTPPAAHGTAGSVTHAFTQPDAHSAMTHSTVAIVPAFFALAFIQRMS